MTKRIALIDGGGLVDTVAIFSDDWNGSTWDNFTAVVSPDKVGPGWYYLNSQFVPPPSKSLTADPTSITTSGTSVVTYFNTYADCPSSVDFNCNGQITTVPVTNNEAQLEIAPSGTGPIDVRVEDLLVTIEVQ